MFHNRKNTKVCALTFVGTQDFLKGMELFLGIKGLIRNKSSKGWDNKAYEIRYSGVKARQIARLMYENSIVYMDRKYKIYESFCRFEEESSERLRKSSKISRRWDVNTEVTSEITKGSEALQRVEGE